MSYWKTALYSGMLTLFIGVGASAGVYEVDVAHTKVGFKVRHLGISSVEGHFGKFEGTVETDSDTFEDLVLSATVEVDSIDTDNEDRDKHLKSPDFFNAEEYPLMTFQSTKVSKDGDGLKVMGDFTLHGVTKEIELEMEVGGKVKDPWGNERIGLSGTGKINRQDFGLSFSKVLETGQLMVGDTVTIRLEIEAVQKK